MKKAQVLIEYVIVLLFGVIILFGFVALFYKAPVKYIQGAGGSSLWAKFQHSTIHVRPMTK